MSDLREVLQENSYLRQKQLIFADCDRYQRARVSTLLSIAATGAIPEGIAAQAEQSCKNVGAILEAAGVTLESVVKTTCFLADMGDFAAFNEVYAKYFTSKPARSCVAVRELPKGVLCEIEAIAVK